MVTTFKLNNNEIDNAKLFIANHESCKGQFSFIFTPKILGTVVKVRCEFCGAEEDITDYGAF